MLVSVIGPLVDDYAVVDLELPEDVVVAFVHVDEVDFALDYLVYLGFWEHVGSVYFYWTVEESWEDVHYWVVIYIAFLNYFYYFVVGAKEIFYCEYDVACKFEIFTPKVKDLPDERIPLPLSFEMCHIIFFNLFEGKWLISWYISFAVCFEEVIDDVVVGLVVLVETEDG